MLVYDAQKSFLGGDEFLLYRAIVEERGFRPENPVDTEVLSRRQFYGWSEEHFDIVLQALLKKGMVIEKKEERLHMEIAHRLSIPARVRDRVLHIKRDEKIIKKYVLLDGGDLRSYEGFLSCPDPPE